MANPKEWGPLLWKILHTCCEGLGKNTKPLLQADEMNAFKQLLLKTGSVLPCVICRKHFHSYYLKNKKDINYIELKDYAKHYYYGLHEQVNIEKGIPPFGYENLVIYTIITRQELNELIKEFEKLFQKYVMYHFIHPNAIKDFLMSLRMLRVSML